MNARWPWPVLLLALLGAKPVLSGPPETVAWSADSERVVLGGRRTGTIVLDRKGKGGLLDEKLVTNATLSADGRWVVAAREADFVAIDIDDRVSEPIPVPGGRGRPVLYLRTANGDVMVVRQTANHEIHRFGGPLTAAVSESTRNYVRLWADPEDPVLYLDTGFGLEVRHQWSGQLLRALDAQRGDQRVLDAIRDDDGGLVIALRDEDGFRVWTPPDPPGGSWDIPEDAPVALSGDGRFVAVGGPAGVELRSTATREIVSTLKTKGAAVAVGISPDSSSLVAVSATGHARVFALALPDLPPAVDRPLDPADPGRILSDVLRRPAPPLTPFDQKFRLEGAPAFLWRSPSGRLAGWIDLQWTELDTATGKTSFPKMPRLIPGSPYAWSDDGTALAGGTETGVALVDLRRSRVLRELPTGGRHQQLQWRGKVLVVDVGAGRAQPWDPVLGTPLAEPYPTSPDPIAKFVLSPNGELLAVRGKVPIVLRAATGQPVKPLAAQAGGVSAVAWSADGGRLATSGNDGTLLVWDTASWTPTVLVEGAHGLQVAFSPDGSRLASVSYDGTFVADTATGQLLEELPFDGLLTSVEWTSHGLEITDNAGNVYVRR